MIMLPPDYPQLRQNERKLHARRCTVIVRSFRRASCCKCRYKATHQFIEVQNARTMTRYITRAACGLAGGFIARP